MRAITPHSASWLAASGMAAVAVVSSLIAPQYYVTLLVVVGIKALAVSGLTLLLLSGQVSLGHAAYMGIGAYVAGILARDGAAPALVCLAIGIAASAIVGFVVGGVTLRLRGIFLPLATLAIGIAVPAAIVGLGPITGGASGLGQIPSLRFGSLVIDGDRDFAVVVWILLAVIAGGLARAMHSRTGRAVLALRMNAELAEVSGVDTAKLKLIVMVIAAALAGLAGGLYGFYFRFLSPAPFALSASISLLIACVLGGAGHPFGAVIGAIAVLLIETLLQNVVARSLGLSGHFEMIVFGIILIVVLIKWPNGLWSVFSRWWPSFAPARPPVNVELAPVGSISGGNLLSLSKVSKSFSGLLALHDVSLSVGPKEIVGLIGPNGAGKSTAFNVLTGLIKPTSGAVSVMNAAPPRKVSNLVRVGVARTFQHVKIVQNLTVLENVALGAYPQGKSGFFAGMFGFDRKEEARNLAKAWRALELIGLDHLANQQASLLAMGQARLVEIARALVSRPRLLLLDEPAAGLRTGEKLELVRLLYRLKRSGISVLLVEHDMDLVMNCVDRVVVLDRGCILSSGLPEDVRQDPTVVRAYLGG